MPGTIALMRGKTLLELRTYNQSKEIRKLFEELHAQIRLLPAQKYWKNGKVNKKEPPLHFLISTFEE
jgi:hypothetical protein